MDAVDTCAIYDTQCHVQQMAISESMIDPADAACSDILSIYNKLNSSTQFVRAGLKLNTLTDMCQVSDRVLELSIKSNYYSPLGEKDRAANSCSLLNRKRRAELSDYLTGLGVDPISCSVNIRKTSPQKNYENSDDCDFTCAVIHELKNPSLDSIAGEFATKFKAFKSNPDMLAKIAVYYEKKYNQKADLIAIRNAFEQQDLKSDTIVSIDSVSNIQVSLHRGIMEEDKFAWLVAGAKYALSITSHRAELIIDNEPSKVITYAKSNQAAMRTIALGGFPLLLNKQHGLSQIHSLFSSIALSITSDIGEAENHFVISNKNPISQQLNYHIKDPRFITVDKMDTDTALDVVRKISEVSPDIDDKGQPKFVGKITVIGDHIFAGFLIGTIKVKLSSKSAISWRTITTNVKDFSASELRDMPGYESILPNTVKSVYNAFLDSYGDSSSVMGFAHFLIGYQTFILLSEGEENLDCEITDHAKRADSGDYITCL